MKITTFSTAIFLSTLAVLGVATSTVTRAEACTYSEALLALSRGNSERGMALMAMASRDGDQRAEAYIKGLSSPVAYSALSLPAPNLGWVKDEGSSENYSQSKPESEMESNPERGTEGKDANKALRQSDDSQIALSIHTRR